MEMMVFLTIGLVGMGFFLISSLFGDHDSDVDHDFDHGGDFDHDTDTHHGPSVTSIFSVKNFFLFMVGFGGVGMIATYYGCSPMAASLWGFASGIVVVALGMVMFRVLYGQQSNSLTSNSSLVNSKARVTVAIPAGGLGQVVATTPHGSERYLSARSADAKKRVALGTVVTVTDIVGGTAIVSF